MDVLNYHNDNIISTDAGIIDDDWLKDTLGTSIRDYDKNDLKYLFYSAVMEETMDTSLGGHLCINPPYGFTPGADSYYKGKIKGRVDDTPEGVDFNIGMGRKYYEYIQANSKTRTLSLSFGIPEFQGIIGYIMGAVDYSKMIIVNEGRSPKWYYIGKDLGTLGAMVANPIFTASFFVLTKAWGIVFGASDPRFYHMKPDMVSYYSSFNIMMQMASAERGFTKLNLVKPDENKKSLKVEIDSTYKDNLHRQLPRIFNEDGVIDVLKVTSRYQKLLNTKMLKEAKFYDEAKSYTKQAHESSVDNDLYDDVDNGNKLSELSRGMSKLASFAKQTGAAEEGDFEVNAYIEGYKKKDDHSSHDPDYYKPDADGEEKVTDTSDWAHDIQDYFKASLSNTSNSIFLQVEHLGSSTDTFSNTTKDLPAKNFFNSTSSAFRDIRFSLAGTDVITNSITNMVKNVRDVAAGVLDGASLGLTNVIHTLIGGGFVDMPKTWDDSNAKFAEHQFKVVINEPYGNMVSLLMDVDYVVYSLLAGMLPRSIGRAAYSSPLLCSGFIPGFVNIDLGLITDLAITRGSGTIGTTDYGAPLNMEITFTITDLNDVVSAPISDGYRDAYRMNIDEHSMFNKYVRMVSGSSFSDSKFIKRRAMIRLSSLYGVANTLFDGANLAFLAGENKGPILNKVDNVLRSEQSGIWMFND